MSIAISIEEFIKATKAQIVVKDNKSRKRVLKINVSGYTEENQRELEEFAHDHKDDIVRELQRVSKMQEQNTSLSEELHNYYVAKNLIDEYEQKYMRYQLDPKVPAPVRPKNMIEKEYAKLSFRAKAYLRADSFSKSENTSRKKAGKKAKQKIQELTQGTDAEYENIIRKMEQEVKEARYINTTERERRNLEKFN